MKKALHFGTSDLGSPFMIPLEFVTRTLAIVAIRGAGKTVAATVLAEEMCEAGLPWIAFDPTPLGTWWGLRANPDGSPGGYPVLIVGGNHGDLPFRREAAVPLAEAFVRENVCIVVDVHKESKTVWRGFVADFCDRLMELEAPTPRHVFVEEGPEFVPQKPMAEQKRSRAALDRVIRLGRNAGYGCTVLSQRFATIDKDVLTQCENIFAMRSVGKPDRKAVKEWIAETVSPAPDDPLVEKLLGSLTGLPDGDGWFWSPQWLKRLDRVHVRARRTYHPGRTREVGEKAQTIRLSSVADFVARFRPVLEEQERTAKPPRTKVMSIAERTAFEPEAERAILRTRVEHEEMAERLERAEGEAGQLRGQVADLHRQLGAAKSTINALREQMRPQFEALSRLFAELEAGAVDGGIDRSVYDVWLPKLHAGARAMLQMLIERGGELELRQLAVLLGVKQGTGAWRKNIGQLRSCGLVEKGDPVKLRVP